MPHYTYRTPNNITQDNCTPHITTLVIKRHHTSPQISHVTTFLHNHSPPPVTKRKHKHHYIMLRHFYKTSPSRHMSPQLTSPHYTSHTSRHRSRHHAALTSWYVFTHVTLRNHTPPHTLQSPFKIHNTHSGDRCSTRHNLSLLISPHMAPYRHSTLPHKWSSPHVIVKTHYHNSPDLTRIR